MGLVQCCSSCPIACCAGVAFSGIAGYGAKVPQEKWRAMTRSIMIVLTIVLALATFALFTFSNPFSTGGPALRRPLATHANFLGGIMAFSWCVPLVLSCVYPVYGSMCCLDARDKDQPSDEKLPLLEHEKQRAKFDYFVLVLGGIHWTILFAFVGAIVYVRFGQSWASQT
eukprot:TRINITY_DN28157_c0_g1_i1.p1 TRINITY_DN28157_c0_g1~~TRINITY_DN28157_c0_g1_i1.p1  ORF type:complete len:170 (+),score=15.46 TRINITY_DN28157_c0_g1_i1:48-557(+)